MAATTHARRPTGTDGPSADETALLDALRRRIADGRAAGALESGVDVELLADRMLAALPSVKHEADALIGRSTTPRRSRPGVG